MRIPLCAAMCLVLTSCSEPAEVQPEAPEPPSTYYIRKVDIYREVPRDFCQRANDEFLTDLVRRVTSELPVDLVPTFRFEDFDVTDPDAQGQRTAILRFRVEKADGTTPMMVAGGPFIAEGCKIPDLKIAEGTSTMALD